MKIYIITHKDYNFPKNPLYIPLQVGTDLNKKIKSAKEFDNTENNISSKNPNFCELTGLYWIWKNSDASIIGFVHYRRYFFEKELLGFKKLLSEKYVIKCLKNNDIILPKKNIILKYNLKEQYYKIHNKNDLDLCYTIIQNKYPEYIDDFNKVFDKHEFYAYNMFVCKKEILDKYCTWLFDILFDLEKKVDLSSYDDYNKRIFGFVSERLFNVWILHNNLRCKELPVYQTDISFCKQKITNFAKTTVKIFLK